MENKNQVKLHCSKCNKENIVNLSSDIKCKECEESLMGYSYKTFIFPTIFLVGMAGFAGAIVDDTININRASVKTEYKMMKTCINKFGDRDTCFCAVESMSGVIDAQKARLNGTDWLKKVLSERYSDCLN